MTAATRGDFAFRLFEQGGYDADSAGVFSDAAGTPLDAALSALSDAGVSQGISEDEFGALNKISRGEAFTMLARHLGLADPSTSIADASNALVSAGVVQGRPDGTLGLAETLTSNELDLLLQQSQASGISPVGPARQAEGRGDRLDIAVFQDPEFAGLASGLGLSGQQAQLAYDNQSSAFEDRLAGLAQDFASQRLNSSRTINQDFEARGFFGSGARERVQDENTATIANREERATSGIEGERAAADVAFEEGVAERERLRSEGEVAARARQTSIAQDRYLGTYIPNA